MSVIRSREKGLTRWWSTSVWACLVTVKTFRDMWGILFSQYFQRVSAASAALWLLLIWCNLHWSVSLDWSNFFLAARFFCNESHYLRMFFFICNAASKGVSEANSKFYVKCLAPGSNNWFYSNLGLTTRQLAHIRPTPPSETVMSKYKPYLQLLMLSFQCWYHIALTPPLEKEMPNYKPYSFSCSF